MGGLEKIIDSIAAEAKGEADEINQKRLPRLPKLSCNAKKRAKSLKKKTSGKPRRNV